MFFDINLLNRSVAPYMPAKPMLQQKEKVKNKKVNPFPIVFT